MELKIQYFTRIFGKYLWQYFSELCFPHKTSSKIKSLKIKNRLTIWQFYMKIKQEKYDSNDSNSLIKLKCFYKRKTFLKKCILFDNCALYFTCCIIAKYPNIFSYLISNLISNLNKIPSLFVSKHVTWT